MEVAGFLGAPATNLITAPVVDGAARVGEMSIPVPTSDRTGAGITVGIRPESFVLAAGTDSDAVALTVGTVEYLGAESLLHLTVPDGGDWTTESGSIVVRLPGRIAVTPGDTVRVRPVDSPVLFFDPETGYRVR